MRAKFVFENTLNFREDSDPVEDMGIGKHRPRTVNSKTWKVLDFIKSKGEEGASLSEIQYFIWVTLNGNDPEDFWRKDWEGRRATRGYWCTQLYGHGSFVRTHFRGGNHGHEGILKKFCKYNPETRKWVFVKFPKPSDKIYTID